MTDGQEVADSRQFIVHLFQHSLAQLVTSGALCNRQGDRGTEQARRVSRPTQPRLPCVSLTRPCLCTKDKGWGPGDEAWDSSPRLQAWLLATRPPPPLCSRERRLLHLPGCGREPPSPCTCPHLALLAAQPLRGPQP